MKPILEQIFLDPGQSLHVHHGIHKCLDYPFHYAPEIEIIHMIKSRGTSIIGNSITNFEEGDVVMVGAYVPHVWRNDKEYYDPASTRQAEFLVIHFRPDFLGKDFFSIPEFSALRKLFKMARRGIRFKKKARKQFGEQMFEIYRNTGQKRIMLFLNLLHAMSLTRDYEILSSMEYLTGIPDEESEKINKIYDYLLKNYASEIDFGKIAELVHMSLPSLCRYFKKHTFKTITGVLNEIRIRQACKLLSYEGTNAKEACFLSGFNNYSHFNKQFKKIIGITPLRYQKEYLDKHFQEK